LNHSLIIGYGNLDRGDDGVAWHILTVIAQRLRIPVFEANDNHFEPQGELVDLLFQLQLTPELAETIAAYQKVCFVDAHTYDIIQQVHITDIQPKFQASPFTHHLTPETCLALTNALYQKTPAAVLISVRGHQFGFSRSLSPQTAALATQAVDAIFEWLEPLAIGQVSPA
jgi:hydrogenase maturation protease